MELREQIAAYKPKCAQEQADRGLMLVYLDRFDDVLTREIRSAILLLPPGS